MKNPVVAAALLEGGDLRTSPPLSSTGTNPNTRPDGTAGTAAPAPRPPTPTQLTDKAGVARALLVSPRTIDRWVQQGQIPVFLQRSHCRRFHLPDVMAALAGKGRPEGTVTAGIVTTATVAADIVTEAIGTAGIVTGGAAKEGEVEA